MPGPALTSATGTPLFDVEAAAEPIDEPDQPPNHPADGPGGPPEGPGDANRNQIRMVVRLSALFAFWFAAMAITLFALGSDRVPEGTKVSGVDIGGLDRDTAVSVLHAAFEKRATAPFTVKALEKTIRLEPQRLGLNFDPEATVDHVVSSRVNPFDLLRAHKTGGIQEMILRIDEPRLMDEIAKLAGRFDQKPTEPEITYDLTVPLVNSGKSGTSVDRRAAAGLLVSRYLKDSTDLIELPVTSQSPLVSGDDARAAAAGPAAAAVSGPITLNVGALSAKATPEHLAASLSFQVRDGQLKPVVDGQKLRELMAGALRSVDTPAADATWSVASGKPVVVPSKDGSGVTDDAVLASSVTEVLDKSGSERIATVPVGPLKPKLTTEAAGALGITDKLAGYTQRFPYAAYRYQNIGGAAKKINKTLLMPGDVFSMNGIVGERTKANGFTEGLVVGDGGKFRMDLGGGVSAAATATYVAAFYAGLESVERGAHTIWISRYTPGLEATVAWGQLDMKFRNNSPSGVFVTTKMTGESLTVNIWGKKQFDEIKAVSGQRENITPFTTEKDSDPKCVPQGGVEGFDIKIDRVFIKDGQEVARETIPTHYMPAASVTCVPKSELKLPPVPATAAGPHATAPATSPG